MKWKIALGLWARPPARDRRIIIKVRHFLGALPCYSRKLIFCAHLCAIVVRCHLRITTSKPDHIAEAKSHVEITSVSANKAKLCALALWSRRLTDFTPRFSPLDPQRKDSSISFVATCFSLSLYFPIFIKQICVVTTQLCAFQIFLWRTYVTSIYHLFEKCVLKKEILRALCNAHFCPAEVFELLKYRVA